MKFTQLSFALIALFATTVIAAPGPVVARDTHVARDEHYARSVCQFGSIFGAGDAACSADCIARGEGLHGGFCNDQQVCVCTH